MKKLLFLTTFLVSFCCFGNAQIKKIGKIKLTEEKGIKALLDEQQENLQGYRIQVFTGNTTERAKAESIKKEVEEKYQIATYVEYSNPLFKVRVGDFIDKIEAIQLKHKLEKEYPNTYIVKVDKIAL